MKKGIFAVIYGPSKTGKSTATGAAGSAGLFIAQGGGLLPLTNYLGIENIEVRSAKTLKEAAVIIEQNCEKYPTIVVDDFSLLAEVTIGELEKTHSFGDMWRQLRADVFFVRDAARYANEKGTHVIFNCHYTPARVSSGKYVRGGPKLPGQLPEQFSAFADVVAQVEYDETAAPWKYVLRTGPDKENIRGDRLSIFPDPAPMNLGEALRAAGYEVSRPKGMEWMEKTAESLAVSVLAEGIEEWRETLKAAAKKLEGKKDTKHIRWVLQDALHRAVIRNSRDNLIDEMFVDSTQDVW
tara:strand:- start:2355 stop:3242 length:888 start_codon:yes stop_codon:yes gene_type:complete